MQKVYRKAIVTLVATSATCSYDGFLHRDLRRFPGVKLAYPIVPLVVRPVPRPQSPKPFWRHSKKNTSAASAPVPRANIVPQNPGYMVICYPE